jgi:hypothetical protein
MLAWVEEAHLRFNTPALKAQARMGEGLAKPLLHEALPMARFAYQHFQASSEVMIRHVLGNQNYDGVIEDQRTNPEAFRYLEVTTTLQDYAMSLRMEILNRDGHVPLFGL